MRTKTLLLTAALAAAGVASSMAQVYSANVVGYVNQLLPAETLVAVGNPLDAATNDLDTVLGGVPNKSTAQFWTGTGFTPSTKLSGGWSPNMAIPPGVGFFVNSKSSYTNTYVGEVAAAPGGSVTNSLPAEALVMVASMLPFAGDMNDTNLNLNLPNKSTAQFWNGAGYDPSTKLSAGWSPALPVEVGQGFFLNSKSAHDWVQTLPAN